MTIDVYWVPSRRVVVLIGHRQTLLWVNHLEVLTLLQERGTMTAGDIGKALQWDARPYLKRLIDLELIRLTGNHYELI